MIQSSNKRGAAKPNRLQRSFPHSAQHSLILIPTSFPHPHDPQHRSIKALIQQIRALREDLFIHPRGKAQVAADTLTEIQDLSDAEERPVLPFAAAHQMQDALTKPRPAFFQFLQIRFIQRTDQRKHQPFRQILRFFFRIRLLGIFLPPPAPQDASGHPDRHCAACRCAQAWLHTLSANRQWTHPARSCAGRIPQRLCPSCNIRNNGAGQAV